MDLSRTSTTITNPEDRSWIIGRHGEDSCVPVQLDATVMLAAFPAGLVPSGVEISKLTATGRWVLGAGTGTDAGQRGFLYSTTSVQAGVNPGAAVFWHGAVVKAKIAALATAAGQSAVTASNHPAIFIA